MISSIKQKIDYLNMIVHISVVKFKLDRTGPNRTDGVGPVRLEHFSICGPVRLESFQVAVRSGPTWTFIGPVRLEKIKVDGTDGTDGLMVKSFHL